MAGEEGGQQDAKLTWVSHQGDKVALQRALSNGGRRTGQGKLKRVCHGKPIRHTGKISSYGRSIIEHSETARAVSTVYGAERADHTKKHVRTIRHTGNIM